MGLLEQKHAGKYPRRRQSSVAGTFHITSTYPQLSIRNRGEDSQWKESNVGISRSVAIYCIGWFGISSPGIIIKLISLFLISLKNPVNNHWVSNKIPIAKLIKFSARCYNVCLTNCAISLSLNFSIFLQPLAKVDIFNASQLFIESLYSANNKKRALFRIFSRDFPARRAPDRF